MKTSKYILPFSVLLALSSCYVNKAAILPDNYVPPNPYTYWTYKIKPHIKSEVKSQSIDEKIPLSIAELIDIALHSSPVTKASWAQARLAAAQYGQSQYLGMPSADFDFSWDRFRSIAALSAVASSTFLEPTPYYLSVWGPQVSLSYLIFDFGTQRATTQAARYALYFANWTQNRSIQTLVQTITTDYYNLAYQQQLYLSYEEDLETARVTLSAAKDSLLMGVKSVSDVLQAETQYLQYELQLIAQKQAIVNAHAQLLTDTGLPANMPLETIPMPSPDPTLDFLHDVSEFVADALDLRADLLAAKAQVKQTKESLKAAQRQRLPQLNVNFDVGKTYYSQGINDGYDFNLLFSLSFPIFKGFYYRNAIKQAEANEKIAKANFAQVELAVISEVITSHEMVKTSYDSIKASNVLLKTATEQYKVALAQYKVGTASILDVTTAQSALANARASQAQARQEWFTALSSLAYATGSLTDPAIKLQEANIP